MYFPTFNGYFEDMNASAKKEDRCCIICWENDDTLEDLQITIKNLHSCSYNSYFHKKCLQTWFSKNHYCPMCREKINNTELLTTNSYSEKTIILIALGINYCRTLFYVILTYICIYSPYVLMFYTIKQLKNL